MAARLRRSSIGGALRVKLIEDEDSETYQTKSSITSENINNNSVNQQRYSISSSPKPSKDISILRKSISPLQDTLNADANSKLKVNENIRRKSSYGVLNSDPSINERLSAGEDELSHPDRSWCVNDFILGKPLGKGKFGNVYQAKQKRSNVSVALKVMFKQQMCNNSSSIEALRREVEIQCRMKHPNIVQLYGYFHDTKSVYLILEYVCNGELFKYLHQNGGKISEEQCKIFMRDIASAVHFMHSRSVYHRDIKPENILIGDDGKLRIADFGWAVHAPAPDNIRHTVCGTAEYLSPEMLSDHGHDSGVDLWAMGILMYELLIGRTPFHEKPRQIDMTDDDQSDAQAIAQQRTYTRIRSYNGQLTFNRRFVSRSRRQSTTPIDHAQSSEDETIPTLSDGAKDVILSLLRPLSSDRCTAFNLLQKDWLFR